MRVDRQAGVIRGVKVLGLESRNGRTYLPEALAQAAPLYEDAKVNVNHPKGNPAGPRDYQDRIGTIRHVAVRPGEGLFGDFHFNPKHALAEQLMWDAEHAPENVGFSHNVEARVGRRGDRVVVEAITRVQSVDLVADPATTRGLFESAAAETGAGSRRTGGTAEPLTLDDLQARLSRAGREHSPGAGGRTQPASARGGPADGVGSDPAEAQHGAAAARASSICPTPRRPSRGRRPSSASGSSNRSWRRPTNRRCARWWKSGRGWCGRSPAAMRRAASPRRGRNRAISTWCMPPARWTPRVLWKRLRERERDQGLGIRDQTPEF